MTTPTELFRSSPGSIALVNPYTGEEERIESVHEMRALHCIPNPPFTNMASSPHTVDLLCSLVLFTEPRVIVEAGTYLGHTALSIANILKWNGMNGHIWTADPHDPYTATFQKAGIGAYGVEDFVTYWHGSFDDMILTVPEPIDLAYLDASGVGDPEMRWRHFHLVVPRLRPGGLVLIDDLNGEWPHSAELRDMALLLSNHRGLGLFQRRLNGAQ